MSYYGPSYSIWTLLRSIIPEPMVRWRTVKFLWNCQDNSFLLRTRSYWLSYQFGHKWSNTIRVSVFFFFKQRLVSERCPHRFDGQPYLGIWAVTKMFRTSRFRDTPGFPGFVPQGFLRFRFSIWIKAAATLHMALPDYQTLRCIIAINYTALQYRYTTLHYTDFDCTILHFTMFVK